LDLTHNKLYGEFPRFLVAQAADLSDSCLCSTNFTVSAGNQLYCPTKSSLEGINVTPNLLETFKEAKYTCLMPNQKEPVSVLRVEMQPKVPPKSCDPQGQAEERLFVAGVGGLGGGGGDKARLNTMTQGPACFLWGSVLHTKRVQQPARVCSNRQHALRCGIVASFT
jgi:hypothetical protein